MNPNLSANEHKIREAIRGLSCTLEERDWQQMSALLDNVGKSAPNENIPGTIAPPGDNIKKRYWLFFLFLFGISCVCYCIYGSWLLKINTLQSETEQKMGEGQNAATQDTDQFPISYFNKSAGAYNNFSGGNSNDPFQVFRMDQAFQFPVSNTWNWSQSVTPFFNSGIQPATGWPSGVNRENRNSNLESIGGQKEIISGKSGLSAPPVVPPFHTPSEKIAQSATNGNKDHRGTLDSETFLMSTENEQLKFLDLPPELTATSRQSLPAGVSIDTTAHEPHLIENRVASANFNSLSLRWSLADTINKPRLDSLVKPQPPMGRYRRVQRGWIVGGNLTLVDYPDRQFSALPHFGYHYSMYLSPGYRLQTELQFKYVTHYSEKSDFKIVVPSSSMEVTWNLQDLLFIELPVLIKKSAPDYRSAWLFGVSPTWCKPLWHGGLNSVSISGSGPTPNVNISLEDGLQRFDIRFILGREWRISPRWGIDFRYSQGIFDLTHDNFFKNNTTHLNTDIQITFRHYVKPYKNKRDRSTPRSLFPEPLDAARSNRM
jgi:hypothetical protein